MIDANTKLLGIIGDPVEHSLSPRLQNYLIKRLNQNFSYLAFQVASENLSDAVSGLKTLGAMGFNVTVPHKQAIVPLLDELSDEAKSLGAVNTVVRRGDEFVGHNTDWQGFLQPLQARNIDLKGQRVVMLGAGGAALGVAFALIKSGIAQLTMVNRTAIKADALADHLKTSLGFERIEALSLDSGEVQSALHQADLLVNATSVGMWPEENQIPLPADVLHSDLIVYDLVYNPLETRLLKEAKQAGAHAIDGLHMLIGQGVAAFSLWTNIAIADIHVARLHQLLTSNHA